MRVKSWPKKSYEAANGRMCEMLTPLFSIFEDGGAAVEILWWMCGGGNIVAECERQVSSISASSLAMYAGKRAL